jgi:hypothetical protein
VKEVSQVELKLLNEKVLLRLLATQELLAEGEEFTSAEVGVSSWPVGDWAFGGLDGSG